MYVTPVYKYVDEPLYFDYVHFIITGVILFSWPLFISPMASSASLVSFMRHGLNKGEWFFGNFAKHMIEIEKFLPFTALSHSELGRLYDVCSERCFGQLIYVVGLLSMNTKHVDYYYAQDKERITTDRDVEDFD